MTRKIAAALAFAVLAAAGAARAGAPSPAPSASPTPAAVAQDVQKTLAANYALGCAAAFDPTDANLNAAFAVLAPSFDTIDPTGRQVSREQVVELLGQQLKMLKTRTCGHAIESFTSPDPATVIVVSTLHLEGDIQAPDGKHDLDLTDKSQDTWKNASGSWQETESKHLHVLVKIDGNIIQDAGS